MTLRRNETGAGARSRGADPGRLVQSPAPGVRDNRFSPFLLVLLVAASLVGVFFRFHNLDRKVYWNDELWTSLWVSGYSSAEMLATVPAQTLISPDDLLKYQRLTPGRNVFHSLAALRDEDPKQPALYLFLARTWAGLAGDSPGTIRLLSAILSLLVLPAAWWFCRELFDDRNVAVAAVLLIAASPFHVLYAQEARPYSLWALTILLSGAPLLRAPKRPSTGNWAMYSLALALGLYSHTLFGLVIAGHLAFVWFGRDRRQDDRGRKGEEPAAETLEASSLRSFLYAGLAGFSLYLPWAWFIVTRMTQLRENTSWVAEVTGYPPLLSRLAMALTSPFIDSGAPHGIMIPMTPGGYFVAGLTAATLVVIAASLLALHRQAAPAARLFVLTMILPTALAMILPDLVLGGSGITTARFLLSALIGLEIAVAFYVARLLAAPVRMPRLLGQALVAGLVVAGITSMARSAPANTWWSKYLNMYIPELAARVNGTPRPLLLGDDSGVDLKRLLALAWLLKSNTAIFLVRDPAGLSLPEGYSDVFWYAGKADVRMDLERFGFRFLPEVKDRGLWRVEPPRPAAAVRLRP